VYEGLQCGPFDLVERIGHGSSAEVWRATHRDSSIDVALKVFHRARARAAFALRNEVRAAARLDHPNIVMLFDQGLTADAPALLQGQTAVYLAMELCTGGALSARTQRAAWDQLRERLIAMLGALAHAHSRGVIHRDLKPSNVLLSPNETGEMAVKLSDFGIAHALVDSRTSAEPTDPRQGRLSGTLQYMAPEQLAGLWRDEGPWTDLYALGVMAYEATCGIAPWRATTRNELLGKLVHSAPPLRARMPVPNGLQSWIDKLLARAANERFQSASEALRELLALGATAVWGRVDSPAPPASQAPPASPQTPHPPRLPVARALALQGIGLSLYGLRPTPLVGRSAQRDAVWPYVVAAMKGDGPQAIVIRGPMGVGTSKFASWISEHTHAQHGALRLHATHSPIAGPSDGLAAMVRKQLRASGLDTSGQERRAARHIQDFPLADDSELESISLAALLSPVISNPSHTVVMAEQQRTIQRFLLRTAKRQPVVLTIDNAQWGQNALELCRALMDAETDSTPLLLLVLIDDEALASDSAEALDVHSFVSMARVNVQQLGPLSRSEHRELIVGTLGLASPLVDLVVSRTDGDALFSASLLRYWVQADKLVAGRDGFVLRDGEAANIPKTLVRVWGAQLDVLSEQLPDISAEHLKQSLEIAAALGVSVQDNEWRAACSAAGIAVPDRLVQGLAELNLVTVARVGWHFRHASFRDHLELRAIRDKRWRSHHEHCADALSRTARASNADDDRTQARIGQHRVVAGQFAEACSPLLSGALAAREASDWNESHRIFDLLTIAAREVGDERLHIEACIERVPCYLSEGKIAKAEELAHAAQRDAQRLGDTTLIARSHMALAATDFDRSETNGATVLLQKALHELGDEQSIWRAQALTKLGGLCMWRRELALASRYFRQAQEILGDDPAYRSERGQTLRGLAHLAHCHEDFAGATRLMKDARDCFAAEGNRYATASCINDLGDLLRHQGNLGDSEKLYREALAIFRSVQAANASTAHCNLGYLLIERSRHKEAEAIFRGLVASKLVEERQVDLLWILCGLLVCVAHNKDWGEWDALQSQISALADSGLIDEDLAGATRLAAGLARRAGHYERARWAYRYALHHYERMDKPQESRTVRDLLTDLGDSPTPS
tara:strand:- start:184437 stop:187844 length:3408 start_codon:yes stop_codon:yes gene_type:complete